jgi:hypothetical protein
LPKDLYDYQKDTRVGLLSSIGELDVQILQLDPEFDKKKDNLLLSIGIDLPKTYSWTIEDGAPDIIALLDSLPPALDVFAKHGREVEKTAKLANERLANKTPPSA